MMATYRGKGGLMESQIYPDGTEIVVLDGQLKGEYGVVVSYEPIFDRYFVQLPNRSLEGHFAFQLDEISPLEEPQEEQEDTEPTDDDPPGFGMTEDEFVSHLEFLMGRSMSKIPTTGAKEAFFGYQEFEGMTAEEVLLSLLDKLEEGIAHLAQAHILIARIGVSYRTIVKEITNDNDD
jgi:hypothetical protein